VTRGSGALLLLVGGVASFPFPRFPFTRYRSGFSNSAVYSTWVTPRTPASARRVPGASVRSAVTCTSPVAGGGSRRDSATTFQPGLDRQCSVPARPTAWTKPPLSTARERSARADRWSTLLAAVPRNNLEVLFVVGVGLMGLVAVRGGQGPTVSSMLGIISVRALPALPSNFTTFRAFSIFRIVVFISDPISL